MQRRIELTAYALSVVAVLSMALLTASWLEDRRILREVALQQTAAFRKPSDKIVALNSWVYFNEGFAKNRDFFPVERLGPTPVQVLEEGGDCADKSRLLAALLAEIGVDSTLAMLYPCATCPPGHTVVEARYNGDSIALDPVYDLSFPDPHGGYFGLRDLSQEHQRVAARINELRVTRGNGDKVNRYDYEEHSYRFVRTVNWDKNLVTRIVGAALEHFGYTSFLVRRPRFLEDPKLSLSIASLFVAIFTAVAGFVMTNVSARGAGSDTRSRRSTSSIDSKTGRFL